jgi:dihydroorotase
MVARDLALARRTGAACHLQHLSTAGAVELVRAAKAAGVAVTCEVTPHHLLLTDAELAAFDPVFKVNPPLRTAADVDALRAAVADGTIDAIATDHAPHAPETKELPIDEAPCGMLGLETAFAVAVTALVVEAGVALDTVVAALSWRPAAIAGLAGEHGGPVAVGRPANLCVLEATRRWVVDADDTASRSRNNPYAGRELTGRVRHTVLRGEPVVIDGVAQR